MLELRKILLQGPLWAVAAVRSDFSSSELKWLSICSVADFEHQLVRSICMESNEGWFPCIKNMHQADRSAD